MEAIYHVSTEVPSCFDLRSDISYSTMKCLSVIHTMAPEAIHAISSQFIGESWIPNRQVLWHGVSRNVVEQWAESHHMQTLTKALGPLAIPGDPKNVKPSGKKRKTLSKFMKGASAVFAWCISAGAKVTILTPPPPQRFNPGGGSNFQAIELPILRGQFGNKVISCIELVHPTVKGAEDFRYRIWPIDETQLWINRFGTERKLPMWRKITKNVSLQLLNLEGTLMGQTNKAYEVSVNISLKRANPTNQAQSSIKFSKDVQSHNKSVQSAQKRTKQSAAKSTKIKLNPTKENIQSKTVLMKSKSQLGPSGKMNLVVQPSKNVSTAGTAVKRAKRRKKNKQNKLLVEQQKQVIGHKKARRRRSKKVSKKTQDKNPTKSKVNLKQQEAKQKANQQLHQRVNQRKLKAAQQAKQKKPKRQPGKDSGFKQQVKGQRNEQPKKRSPT